MSKGIIEMTKRELYHVKAVPFTETWHPVHHTDVIDAVDTALEARNLPTNNLSIEVSESGTEMFANYYLPGEYESTPGHKDQIIIGIRNSMAKRFAVGVVGGNNVYCCSNMCFWGDFKSLRRHTGGLDMNELFEFMRLSVAASIAHSGEFRSWFKNLANKPLEAEARKVLTYDAIEAGVIAPNKWNKFHDAYAEETKANRDGSVENVAHFHGAVTRVLREYSLPVVMDRSRKLNTLLEAHLTPALPVIGETEEYNAAFNRAA